MQAEGDTAQSWVGLVLMVLIRESVMLVLATTKSTLYCSTQSPQACRKASNAHHTVIYSTGHMAMEPSLARAQGKQCY